MTRILITGVRGKTGLPLARSLAARDGVEVLGGSTNPASVAIDGVTPTAFSWDDASGWAAATDGVDALFLVRPDRPDAPRVIAALLDRLPAATRVVLLSERDADSIPWAAEVERVVRDDGRPWTAVRPGWFMQVFTDPRFHGDELVDGRLSFAGGGAAVAWIDARDIAAVAERALLDPGHDGAIHEISGPEALTLPETAAALSDALGHPVEHVELTIPDAIADIPPGFERDEFEWTLERLRDGIFAPVTDTVERVTGHAPRHLRDLHR